MGVPGQERLALLERDTEIATIEEHLARAADGAGSIVLVEGEPGIGKSALMREATARAEIAGLDVLTAAGRELESEFGFGVVLQLLAGRVRAAGADEREQLLEGVAADTLPLLEGSPAALDGTNPFPLVNALTWLVSNMAERHPLALIVDDAHLADAASLSFLAYLGERAPDLAVTLLIAARPAEPGPAADVMPRLRAATATTRLHPQPLTRAAVGWMMSELGFVGSEPAFVEACAQASGGNPFLLRELLFVLGEEAVDGTAASSKRVHEVGPRAVAEAIYLALSSVGPQSTALVRALAVLGAAPLTHVATLANLSMEEAVASAAHVADAGLARAGDELQFAHPILRAAVYADLKPFERSYAHAEAARLLHAGNAESVQVATHLLQADTVGEGWAVAALREAATLALAAGDPPTAVAHLERASAEPGHGDEPALMADLAVALQMAGDERAAATFARARELAPDAASRAALTLALGRDLLGRGDYSGAAAVLQEGVDECPPEATELAADLRSTWAGAALWDPSQGEEAMARTAEVLGSIEEPGSRGEWVALSNLCGVAVMTDGDAETALDAARKAWGGGRALDALGPEDPSLFSATAGFETSDALDEAIDVWNAILHMARARGLPLAAATASFGRGHVEHLRGNLDDGLADTELALGAQEMGWGMYAAAAYWTLARTLLERGQVDRAENALTISAEREAEMARGTDYMGFLAARAGVALAREDHAAAWELCERTRPISDGFGWQVHCYTWRHIGVRALTGLERHQEAVALAEESLSLARRKGAASYVAEALRSLAHADTRRRVELLREAVAVVAGNQRRLEVAHCTVALGVALAERGDHAEARDVLRGGLDVADACTATVLAGRAREALLASGARPRRARTTGAGALTPAELRVARLAADGHTNRQIAEALFVTIKAVKWHLGNVYRKLEIASRDELADALT